MKNFLIKTIFYAWAVVIFSGNVKSQSANDTLLSNVSLENCIKYALLNQPLLQQSILDREITERTVKANLSAWLPQIRSEFNLQHYFKTPVSLVPTTPDPNGPRRAQSFVLPNVSNLLFQADQVLYSSDVLLASRAAGFSRLLADQNIENAKIDLVVDVTKSYYDILLTQQQLGIYEQAILRQRKLLEDSKNQYEAGLVDRLDYMRTSIALNNALAEQTRVVETITAKKTYLKHLMGYPTENQLTIAYDTAKLKQATFADTVQSLKVENRIEYQVLQTQKELQKVNTNYYKWSVLPSVYAYINYNFYYTSREFQNLYDNNYPNSMGGIRVSLPIFQGTRRIQNLQRTRLLVQRIDKGLQWTKSSFTTQYDMAVAGYKSSLVALRTQEANLAVAREVYELVKLQYDHGIKPYLDVISAETDLRNSEINYLNAMFNVLSNKIDVERALGTIDPATY